jgi:hypothetical protein
MVGYCMLMVWGFMWILSKEMHKEIKEQKQIGKKWIGYCGLRRRVRKQYREHGGWVLYTASKSSFRGPDTTMRRLPFSCCSPPRCSRHQVQSSLSIYEPASLLPLSCPLRRSFHLDVQLTTKILFLAPPLQRYLTQQTNPESAIRSYTFQTSRLSHPITISSCFRFLFGY